jgi:hypothetical protein
MTQRSAAPAVHIAFLSGLDYSIPYTSISVVLEDAHGNTSVPQFIINDCFGSSTIPGAYIDASIPSCALHSVCMFIPLHYYINNSLTPKSMQRYSTTALHAML